MTKRNWSIIIWVFSCLWIVASDASTPEDELNRLLKKYQPPTLPVVIDENRVYYQLFVLPERSGDNIFPIIITAEIALVGPLRNKGSGTLRVHARRQEKTEHLGSAKLAEADVDTILRTIGNNEVFSLPMKKEGPEYEQFLHLGGMSYTFIRKDSQSLKVVMRQEWNSESMSAVVKLLGNLASPILAGKLKFPAKEE